MKPTLTDVTGIGASTAKDLADGGIRSIDDLANASASTICAVPGFGPIRAARVKAAAAELIRRSESAAAATVEPAKPELESELESEMTTEEPQVSAIDEDDKPKKKKAGNKDKKTKKGGKKKKGKGKSKKDKADKKGKSSGKKANQSSNK